MEFQKTRTWNLSRMGYTPTVVDFFENQEENLSYLQTSVIIKNTLNQSSLEQNNSSNKKNSCKKETLMVSANPLYSSSSIDDEKEENNKKECIEIPIIIAEIDNCLWEIEYQIDFEILNEQMKIKLLIESSKKLLDIAIWLHYPDIISNVNNTDINFLRGLRRLLNGPNILKKDRFFENDFLFLIENEDYADILGKPKNPIDFGNYDWWLPRGRGRVLSDTKTVKFWRQEGNTSNPQKIKDRLCYPENILEAKKRIKSAQDKSIRRVFVQLD